MGREKQRIVLLQKTIQELNDDMLKTGIVNLIHPKNVNKSWIKGWN